MGWEEDAKTVAAGTGVPRYEWLCSDENPDVWGRTKYREFVTTQAAAPEASFPPIMVQAGNLVAAAGRAV